MRIAILPHVIGLVPLMTGLIKALTAAGHTVHLFIGHYDASLEACVNEYKYTVCRWDNFNLRPIENFLPDRIIVWNGYSPFTIAAYTYLASKYDVLTVERAWLPQSDNNYISDGLAAHSTIRSIVDMSCCTPTVVTPPKQEHIIRPLDTNLPNKFVFIPMQLDTDTSITISSPAFKSIDSLVGFIRYAIGPSIPIIVKNHPIDPKKERSNDVITYEGNLTSNELMSHAQVVIGLTSTCLVECLWFHNNVMSFGYNVAMRMHEYNNVSGIPNPEQFRNAFLTLWSKVKTKDDPKRIKGLTTLLRLQWDHLRVPRWVLDYITAPKGARKNVMETRITA